MTGEGIFAVKTGLRFLHFIGLVMGLGGATLLDFLILRFMVRWRVSHFHLRIVRFSTGVIAAGLVMMWLSGIGLLAWHSVYDPGKLDNEKLWAKLAIVAVLSANGVFIHYAVLPTFKAAIGDHLFSFMTPVVRGGLLFSGLLSLFSWWVAFGLGVVPQLNHVPAGIILAAYLGTLAALFIVLQIAANTLLARTYWRREIADKASP